MTITAVESLAYASWRPAVSAEEAEVLARVLEAGSVLVLPRLAFAFEEGEARFLDPRWSDGRAKNISLDGAAIKGASGSTDDKAALAR